MMRTIAEAIFGSELGELVRDVVKHGGGAVNSHHGVRDEARLSATLNIVPTTESDRRLHQDEHVALLKGEERVVQLAVRRVCRMCHGDLCALY